MNRRIRVLVVDDEAPARARLAALVERNPEVEAAASCASGKAALEAVSDAARSGAPVDIIFLDIQMPELDGFATLEALYALRVGPMPVVVFVTAYDEYAVRAFDAQAIDYLLKPYSDERFEVALTRAIRLVRSGASESLLEQMQTLLGELAKSPAGPGADSPGHAYLDRLALKDRGRVRLIDVSDIRWIDAAGVYVTIHTAQDKYLHREILGRLETQLDPHRFVRIHRSHIVNFDFIQELAQDAHGDYAVILKDAAPLKVGRMYRSRLEARLNQRL
jgi:two-component system LytT family response regulator